MPTGELRLNAEQYLMNTYQRQPISIVRGRGTKVYDLRDGSTSILWPALR